MTHSQKSYFVSPRLMFVPLFLGIVSVFFFLFSSGYVNAGNTVSVPVGQQPLSVSWDISGGYGGNPNCTPSTNAQPLAVKDAWMLNGGATLFGAVSLPPPTVIGSFNFTCTHISGASDTATLNVGSGITAPIVDAGSDHLVFVSANVSVLDASASDPDGLPVTLLWTNTVKPIGAPIPTITGSTTLTPTLTNLTTIGTYVFQLVATDVTSLTATDTMNVVVRNNLPPTANAGGDVDIVEPDTSATPDGTQSALDPEGFPLTILWTNTDKPSGAPNPTIIGGNTLNPTFSNLQNIGSGAYEFTLSVTDSGGLVQTDTMTVTAHPTGWTGGGGSCTGPGPCPPVSPTPMGDLIVDPWVDPGDTATISWTTADATSCTVTTPDDAGNVDSWNFRQMPLPGVESSPLVIDTRYELDCDGLPIDSAVVRIRRLRLSAVPPIVEECSQTKLVWELGGDLNCRLTGGTLLSTDLSDGGELLNSLGLSNGSESNVSVCAKTTFTLTCPSGTRSTTVEVTMKGFET